jgi:pimeloyl-ACP methyl ester carboxylesterase
MSRRWPTVAADWRRAVTHRRARSAFRQKHHRRMNCRFDKAFDRPPKRPMRSVQSKSGYNVATFGFGERVVLVNGIFQTGASWAPFARGLAGQFRVTSFDFPNQGTAPSDPTMRHRDDYCSAVLNVFERLGLRTEDTICVGWSFGANLLTRLVQQHGISFKALFLITPAPLGHEAYMREIFIGQSDAFERAGAFGVAQAFIPRIFSPAFVDSHPGITRTLVAQFASSYARRLGALEALLAASEPAGPSVHLDTPLTGLSAWIVEAEDELLLPPRSLAHTARQLGASYILARGGHACVLEQPEPLSKAFIDAVAGMERVATCMEPHVPSAGNGPGSEVRA